MTSNDTEDKQLRTTALQNAQSILHARRRAEEELRRQSEWLRITLSSIGDAVISTDADGRITFMNGVAEVLTGWPQAAALGQPLAKLFNIVNEHTNQPAENPVHSALEKGTVVGLANHTVLIARDGTRRPIDDSAAPIRDDAGKSAGAVLVFRDVSERKSTEVIQAHLAAIVESSEDAIVSKSLQGIIRSWNRGAERLFGYSADEVVGKSITIIIPPERQEEEDEILARIARGDRVEHVETVRVTKDGRHIDISLTISPIRNPEGRITGASKIARDITDRKQFEAALKDADRRKDQFIALLAHELRNPLAPLRNGLQVMKLAAENPVAIAQAREVMERQLAHMVRLIDDLLDISRISKNKMELRRSRITLSDIIHSASESAGPALEEAGHVLTTSLPTETIHLDGDLMRLSQVFSNLLTNSAKYTDPGGSISIVAKLQNDLIQVSVQDDGIGIPAEEIPRVFEMFSQVDQSIERSKGGLGIGLALARGLIEMHGGTIRAESKGRGQGSVFTVRLPVSRSDGEQLHDALSRDDDKSRINRRRILVVDDNRDAADTLAMMLKLMGNNVQTAYSGADAIKAAEEFSPDTILMDVGMPKMSGYEATQHIRSLPGGQEIIIIALTGWGQEHDRILSREAGCDEHLVKPVDTAALEKMLDRFEKGE